ncbi:alpha/beta hydrolase family protein [Aliikangiella coralliicola]|uniref:Alpha/beta fold hydrolase n=1 Tax=Aliikangiella coralliicola TaxID=2592383 RepID=A0A545U7W6_9GAMM|nr:alpha/beta fold hydrolase [Aliikangiella coralliicola]TQV85557.1 alpha/beta fold hydrolase [Aliikangiella coralliicola]
MHRKFDCIVTLIICVATGFLGATTISLDANAESSNYDPVTMDLVDIDSVYPPAFFELFIPVDKDKLTGFMLSANGKGPHPTIVLLHGLPGNEKNLDLAQSLRRAGFNILFFHYRGSWGSEGKYSFTTLHEDALAAFKFLKENAQRYRVDAEKISVVGHSFGGYAALRSATNEKSLACVTALSAANPAVIAKSERVNPDSRRYIGNYIDQLIMLDSFSGESAAMELVKHQNKMDTRNYGEKLRGKNVLLIVGEEDTVTPPKLQKENYARYSKINGLNVTAKFIPGDHAFSTSRIQMQRLVVNWMSNHCR